MDSGKARKLFEEFAGTLAYVAVAAEDGEASIGSAFHVGEGVFVTARHVVDGMKVTEVRITHGAHYLADAPLQITKGPYFHSNPEVDVAVFQASGVASDAPFVELGGHLDDWLGVDDFVLSEAVVFGYPPIPGTNEPHLVSARCEINALVDLRHAPHVHFILSATPRGGFSGGLVVAEEGIALGVVTSSLVSNSDAAELGFFAVLSVEPLYQCLAENKLLPDCQVAQWGDLWNSSSELDFFNPSEPCDLALRVRASITSFDDGKRMHVAIRCEDENLLDRTARAAELSVARFGPILSSQSGTKRLAPSSYRAEEVAMFVNEAVAAIEGELLAQGLARVPEKASRLYNAD